MIFRNQTIITTHVPKLISIIKVVIIDDTLHLLKDIIIITILLFSYILYNINNYIYIYIYTYLKIIKSIFIIIIN